MKSVTFSNKNIIFPYKSFQTHMCKKINVRLNRTLRRTERYMRKIDLLLKGEYLEITKINNKHIRGDYITFIAHKKKWISKKNYLKIVI